MTMTKAYVIGVVILIAAYLLWFITLQTSQYSELMTVVLWASPFLAALASAFLTQRKKIMLGISMALPSAVLVVVLNFVYQAQGNSVDFSGSRGALILFMTTLIYSGVLCGVGAIVGSVLSKGYHRT